jgi:hypothetical protein
MMELYFAARLVAGCAWLLVMVLAVIWKIVNR